MTPQSVEFKHEGKANGEPIGSVRIIMAGEKRTGGQPYDPDLNSLWFTHQQAAFIARQLGVPLQET